MEDHSRTLQAVTQACTKLLDIMLGSESGR